jgi:hypothetical protein
MTTRSCPLVLTVDSTLAQLCNIRFAWAPLFFIIVSLSVSCFFRVSLSCFRRDRYDPSYLILALRMTYAHNPQSYQLTRNVIVLRLHASGPNH